MRNLHDLSGSELGQLLHCVEALASMRRALPSELFIKLDTFRADLLAEQEDHPRPARRRGQRGGCACGCLCAGVGQAPGQEAAARQVRLPAVVLDARLLA